MQIFPAHDERPIQQYLGNKRRRKRTIDWTRPSFNSQQLFLYTYIRLAWWYFRGTLSIRIRRISFYPIRVCCGYAENKKNDCSRWEPRELGSIHNVWKMRFSLITCLCVAQTLAMTTVFFSIQMFFSFSRLDYYFLLWKLHHRRVVGYLFILVVSLSTGSFDHNSRLCALFWFFCVCSSSIRWEHRCDDAAVLFHLRNVNR